MGIITTIDDVAGGGGSGNVPSGGTAGQLLAKINSVDYNTNWVDAPVATGVANRFALFDAGGELADLAAYSYNPSNFNGTAWDLEVVPVTSTDYRTLHTIYADFNPVVTDSRANWRHLNIESAVGTDDSGKQLGDAVDGSIGGLGVTVRSSNGSSVGRMLGIESYVEIGHNDPTPVVVTANNISVYSGTLQVRENATVSGASLANINFNCAVGSKFDNNVSGINVNGTIEEIDGNGFNAVQSNVNITLANFLEGYKLGCIVDTINNGVNAFAEFSSYEAIGNGYFGVAIQPNIDECEAFYGVNVNPASVGLCDYAYGVASDVTNVTVYPGVVATLVKQDLTFAGDLAGSDYNGVTVEYTGGGTAGAEVVSTVGLAVSVQIESGVSTATQVKAALDANLTASQYFNITISGTASNPQVTSAAENLAGGINPGFKRAGYFNGDVQIDGSLSFSGALSIGAISAFDDYAIIDGAGPPASTHTLITQPLLGDNLTRTGVDYLGVNTAMLLSVGDNSSITTGFLGMTALGLPAVVGLGINSTVDRVGGALFAINLDSGAGAGSSIGIVSLCRSLAIPNGITAVDRLYGYEFELPFGDPGTDTWGLFIKSATKNYLEGALVVGAEDPTNDDVGIEIAGGKTFLCASVDNTEEAALTPVNGMIVYNDQTNKFRGYENGAWVNFV